MNEKINLKELEQKTYKEFLIDGITELFLGGILLFMPTLMISPVFVAFVPFYLFFATQIIEFIRQRTTYPRIGRVEFREDDSKQEYSIRKGVMEFLIFLFVIFVVTFAFMFVLEGEILEIPLWYSWVPFTFGLLMFGPSLFLVEKTGMKYYYLFGIFSSILGLGVSLLKFSDVFDGMILYFFILGIISIILGALRYLWFIRNYPIIPLEEE